VVSFLHDASVATAEREADATSGGSPQVPVATDIAGESGRPATGGTAGAGGDSPWSAAGTASPKVADSAAVRAAAAGAATLERIEAAAAKVEADIAAALHAHAELQAGAGRAAEAAVRAAQEASVAADSAVEADKKARISLHLVARYVTITMALLFVAIIVLVVTATTVH
jgi:hypothetical protein